MFLTVWDAIGQQVYQAEGHVFDLGGLSTGQYQVRSGRWMVSPGVSPC